MSVREHLERLLRMQEIADKVTAARKVDLAAPGRQQEIENRFRERNAEYVAVKERYEALSADQRKRSGDLDALEIHRAKYMDDLMQVTNQREYAAILKEIDTVKSQIADNEEAILKDLEEIESVKQDLLSRESHIQEERKLVEKESAEVEAEAASARGRIAEFEAERRVVESELPTALVATVKRLEAGRQGVFLSRAIDGVCQSCFVRVRPQVFQEIRMAVEIHSCSNCKRLLYHDSSLRQARPEQHAGTDPVEAIDGSSV